MNEYTDWYNLYTINNQFIEKVQWFPTKFTGIVVWYNLTRWVKDGIYHRLDGPAVEYSDGHKEWWVEGKQVSCKSQEHFILYIDIMKLKELI